MHVISQQVMRSTGGGGAVSEWKATSTVSPNTWAAACAPVCGAGYEEQHVQPWCEQTRELTSWQHEAFHVTHPPHVRCPWPRRQQPVGLRCEGRGGQRGWQDRYHWRRQGGGWTAEDPTPVRGPGYAGTLPLKGGRRGTGGRRAMGGCRGRGRRSA